MTDFIPTLSNELGIAPRQVSAVATLLAEGNTIPFIARYRKEAHGNLDEVQIGKIQERLAYHRELEDRRQTVLKSIGSQGKLTDELRARIEACDTKAALEDLYLPYRPKRRTRAMIARERGLGPLAGLILAQGIEGDGPETAAAAFVDPAKEIADVDAALRGARDIVAETVSENADLRGFARETYATAAQIVSEVVDPPPAVPTKFEPYYHFREAAGAIPSHRYLAIRRGQSEGVLQVRLEIDSEPVLRHAERLFGLDPASPWAPVLAKAIEESWRRLISPSVEVDVAAEMKLKADRAAVDIFAGNLRNLLLQPPLGGHPVIGIDPGLRTGCKCAALDATGRFLASTTIYPSQSDRQAMEAQVEICKLAVKYKPRAFAVGNGTAGRETEAFVRSALSKAGFEDILVVSVNESGASVYSASEVAREEFPELDLTVRGAISIGRRLQDPLAELVKIDPKAIGVGQYQHDVYQPLLASKLDEVVVSCVNHVGVELNTASAPLLARVAGVGPSLAKKIVAHRDANGPFASRKELLEVSGLGPRTYEQAAGFLRIRDAANPLDASAVHPERYALVERMAADLGLPLEQLAGSPRAAAKIPIARYVSGEVGEPTLRDIVEELKKPGRDPRATFEPPKFLEGVTEISHVKPGMTLEGIVTNVTAFGAFVDIGVHQDGLVHVSELADRFVRDPSEVVKTGDRITVRVLDVDVARNRISLSARSGSRPASRTAPPGAAGRGRPSRGARPPRGGGFHNNPFASL
ncbi:MAG: Tex family protein [Kiritimatiellia bacterium]|jgi:uncharacterized protein